LGISLGIFLTINLFLILYFIDRKLLGSEYQNSLFKSKEEDIFRNAYNEAFDTYRKYFQELLIEAIKEIIENLPAHEKEVIEKFKSEIKLSIVDVSYETYRVPVIRMIFSIEPEVELISFPKNVNARWFNNWIDE
jgi:hypothetical protein